MNIEYIRAFLEIAATGSFQQAANNLHITQSAMSARIKGLEDQLNRQLFNRKRNGTTLTKAGRVFYRYARTVVKSWEMARQEISLPDEFINMVSLGVQLNHWKSTAAPWLYMMKESASNIATQVHSDYSDRLMASLRDGFLDIAILYEPQQNPDLVIEKYAEEQLIMVSTEPRKVEKGVVPGYVYVDWGKTFKLEHNRAFPDISVHHITVGMAAVGLSHILEQGGSGYFLEREVQELMDDGKLYLVDNAPTFNLTAYVAYFSEVAETPAVQKALQILKKIKY